MPDKDTWRELLRPALRMIASAERSYGRLQFRLGGGTVLMFRFGHRISHDIDVFTYDAQALGFLSPRLNAVGEREAVDYQEQANAVKVVLPSGDIDFIVAAPVIPNAPTETMVFEGRDVVLDSTAEILAKKLAYRADSFRLRDVFDMATVSALDHGSAMAALAATGRTRPALLARLDVLHRSPASAHPHELLVTESGRAYLPGMVSKVREVIKEADRLGTGGGP